MPSFSALFRPPSGRSPGRRALLCDLDGTLIDSAPDLLSALNGLLGAEGRPLLGLEAMTQMVGDGVAKLVERAFAATGDDLSRARLEDLVRQFLAVYEKNSVKDTVVYGGAATVLSGLKDSGWKLAVCTNKPERASRDILDKLDLAHLFDAVSGGDSHAVKKPDPGHLLATIEVLGTQKENCVMLGDSSNDARAAQAAGIPVVLVSFGYCREPLGSLGADAIIDSFAELPAVLSQLSV